MKKISYQEKFQRFKEKIKSDALNDFLNKYQEFKEIEEGLLKECTLSLKGKTKSMGELRAK